MPTRPANHRGFTFLALLLLATPALQAADPIALDQRPAGPSEWGYRPADLSLAAENPPGFCWRPQSKIVRWEVAIAEEQDLKAVVDHATDLTLATYRPSKPLAPGRYVWAYRGFTADGDATEWSTPRRFEIPAAAKPMPMPPRKELLARIPTQHPRLFVRPEELPRLRELAKGDLKSQYEALVTQCEKLLKNPPPTEEPPKYPPSIETKDEQWREIWWGNRTYTVRALNGAATLGFTRLLDGNEEYGQLAKRILLDCAKWDPKGATGYRYNDEAGMPYAYYFSRTYTYIYDLLSEEERDQCREVMRIRGEEMYKHLCPRHLWSPYSSHSNRAWHFLGEVGIAFHGEIENADDWTWFAMNVFYNVYPVWSDDAGGWHEGSSYWSSYISRFTWWADVMRSAVGVNAYDKPYFARVGYYPMYLMPPNKVGGGFGDLTATRTAKSNVPLVSVLAAQAGNPYWQWYVEQMGGPAATDGYLGFVRGALPKVEAKSPEQGPASRLFAGTGQAYLNTTLLDANNDVQVVFKSSPFGTQSHGYEANNSFLLWAYGKRILIRTGRRDIYGSAHHKNWMWSTRSTNNITVDGIGQRPHSSATKGEIAFFKTTPSMDVVVGEAGDCYVTAKSEKHPEGHALKRFTRAMIFVKPELVVSFDRLEAVAPSTFEYWLHAVNEFEINEPEDIRLEIDDVVCPIQILTPSDLTLTQTNEYDPNPRERVKLREWHLTATTNQKAKNQAFVAVMRPQRKSEETPLDAKLTPTDGGYLLTADLKDGGQVKALLPISDQATLQANGLQTSGGRIVVKRYDASGKEIEQITTKQ